MKRKLIRLKTNDVVSIIIKTITIIKLIIIKTITIIKLMIIKIRAII